MTATTISAMAPASPPSAGPSTPGNDREALRLLSDSGNGGTITLEPTPTRETIKKRLATQVLEGFRPCLEAETLEKALHLFQRHGDVPEFIKLPIKIS